MNDILRHLLLELADDSCDDEFITTSEDEVDDSEHLLLCLVENCLSEANNVADQTEVLAKNDEDEQVEICSIDEGRRKRKVSGVRTYRRENYLSNICISKKLLTTLIRQFRHSYYYTKLADHGKKSLSAEKHLLVFLWFIGHKDATYRQVAKYFYISLSTVHLILKRVSGFLCDMYEEVIQWPDHEQRRASAESFHNCIGVKGVIGCIGNLCIKTEEKRTISAQLVFNDKNKIIHLHLGTSTSSNVVASNSILVNRNLKQRLSSVAEHEHLIGDSCYPCLQNLLTPFENDAELTVAQFIYNQKISTCLKMCEQTLAGLLSRFPQLDQLKVRSTKLQCFIVKACFILHNLDCDASDDVLREDGAQISEPELEKGTVKRLIIVKELVE